MTRKYFLSIVIILICLTGCTTEHVQIMSVDLEQKNKDFIDVYIMTDKDLNDLADRWPALWLHYAVNPKSKNVGDYKTGPKQALSFSEDFKKVEEGPYYYLWKFPNLPVSIDIQEHSKKGSNFIWPFAYTELEKKNFEEHISYDLRGNNERDVFMFWIEGYAMFTNVGSNTIFATFQYEN